MALMEQPAQIMLQHKFHFPPGRKEHPMDGLRLVAHTAQNLLQGPCL